MQVTAQLAVRDQNKNLALVTMLILQFKIHESYYKIEEWGSIQDGPDV